MLFEPIVNECYVLFLPNLMSQMQVVYDEGEKNESKRIAVRCILDQSVLQQCCKFSGAAAASVGDVTCTDALSARSKHSCTGRVNVR